MAAHRLPARERLAGRVAFATTAMDAFYEDERIMAHAADSYHRIDIRQASRSLVVAIATASSRIRSGRSRVRLRAGWYVTQRRR
jgi:hypothetical protein